MFRFVELIEPQWGKNILAFLNQTVSNAPGLFEIASISADIFVLTYPIFLTALFLYGWKKHNIAYQQDAMRIMFSVIVATCITIAVQQFVRKDRPETLPGLQLILAHLPTISFPSDHATVSMAIAVWSFFVFTRHRKQYHIATTTIPWILLAFSIIMSTSRVAVAIHRPTDILAWWIIWIIGGSLGYAISGYSYVQNYIISLTQQINVRIRKIASFFSSHVK